MVDPTLRAACEAVGREWDNPLLGILPRLAEDSPADAIVVCALMAGYNDLVAAARVTRSPDLYDQREAFVAAVDPACDALLARYSVPK